jgi:hypothetical protein
MKTVLKRVSAFSVETTRAIKHKKGADCSTPLVY